MGMFDKMTPDGIAQKVIEQIEYFDNNVRSMNDLLSFGLDSDKYSILYQSASNVSLAIGGVCLAIAVIYTYIAIVKEGLSLRGDWKRVVTILLQLAITKGLIDCSTQFMTWIFSFFAKISEIAIEKTTGIGNENVLSTFLKVEDIKRGLNINDDTGIIDLFTAKQYANLLGFFFFVLGVIIFIIGVSRILKIYTLLAFSSVAFSKIPLYGFRGCKDYIKEMCALGLQGGIIAVAIGLFEVASANIANIVTIESTWGSLGSILVMAISMILLIFKSEELARKVV